MIARTTVGVSGAVAKAGHVPSGSLKLGAKALEWRHPPVNVECCLRFCENYTEDPSGLSSETRHTTSPQRPKRADAARNYDKLMAAALEAFTADGEDASLEGIARRAGVGIGTLYRNFPTRQALLEAVYVEEVEGICRAAEELDGGDPWEALTAGCAASPTTPRRRRRSMAS